MGGINHLPTSNVSLSLTVPAAKALSRAIAELMLGNVEIEELIGLTGKTDFGVGRAHLSDACDYFKRVSSQLTIVRSYVRRLINTIADPDYEPFDLSRIDINSFITAAIEAGLLADSEATDRAVETATQCGYSGVFFAIDDLVGRALAAADKLYDTTSPMVDGPEGRQGYFWANVEANRNTWRQDFMACETALTVLKEFWKTTAAICSEVHLIGTAAPSLLVRADAHN